MSHLSVLVVHVAGEAEGVGEALGACTLTHADDAVLQRVEHLAHLCVVMRDVLLFVCLCAHSGTLMMRSCSGWNTWPTCVVLCVMCDM